MNNAEHKPKRLALQETKSPPKTADTYNCKADCNLANITPDYGKVQSCP